MTSGRSKLAAIVALAYTLVIVYASLQPFSGWRIPPDEIFGFLNAPWPRYVVISDVVVNILAYLPLGIATAAALRARLAPLAALVVAVSACALLSVAMESAQMFLPTRIASNLDLLTNAAGGALGALAVSLLALPAVANHPLGALRHNIIRPDVIGDCGILIIALWLLIQLHPAAFALGNGDLREALNITPLFKHTPRSYLLAETSVVALMTAAVGLMISLLTQSQRSPWPAIAATLISALVVKSIATLLVSRLPAWWQWLTPGVAAGAAGGMLSLALLLRMHAAARAVVAVLCIVSGVIVVNMAPDNPYQLLPAYMLSAQPTHWANIAHIAQSLSQAWPALAILFLFFAWRNSHATSSQTGPVWRAHL